MPRHLLFERQQVVGQHAETNQQRSAARAFVDRNADAQGFDEVRCGLPQVAALVQRFVDQRNLAVLEIAQAAVDQPARNRRAPAAHVVLVEHDDLESAQRRIAGDARAIDTSADDREVECAAVGHNQGLTCPLPRTTYL